MTEVFNWIIGLFFFLAVFAWIWGMVSGGIISMFPGVKAERRVKVEIHSKND